MCVCMYVFFNINVCVCVGVCAFKSVNYLRKFNLKCWHGLYGRKPFKEMGETDRERERDGRKPFKETTPRHSASSFDDNNLCICIYLVVRCNMIDKV